MTTNETALLVVQAAIHQILSGDATLTAIVGEDGVLDDVPEPKHYPFVVIGDGIETPDNVHGGFGSRVAHTLHVWSEHRGSREALDITGHIMRLLDHRAIPVAGRQMVACRHEQTITLRDPDPDVRHVAVRFTFESFKL